MASLLQASRERMQKMFTPVWVYNLSDETFSDQFNDETYRIGPKKKMLVPSQIAWLWVGDPEFRKDQKSWYREVDRLKFRRGQGTAYFEKWLLNKKLVVPDFGNHLDGYYGITPDKKEVVHEADADVTSDEVNNPSGLSNLRLVEHVSEEDVFKMFENLVSTGPKGVTGGMNRSLAEELEESSSVGNGGVIDLSRT